MHGVNAMSRKGCATPATRLHRLGSKRALPTAPTIERRHERYDMDHFDLRRTSQVQLTDVRDAELDRLRAEVKRLRAELALAEASHPTTDHEPEEVDET